MRLAARAGLEVADVELGQAKDQPYLLVERYDREVVGGQLSRLHQEDFCQALGVPARQKYEAEGGPSFAESFALLTAHAARPAVDRLRLLRAVAFHFLVGNADAHAKNYALLYRRARPELAPLYDVLSTLVYDGLSAKLAMKIGGEARFDWVLPRHWEIFAAEASLTAAIVRRNLAEMAGALPEAAAEERAGHPASPVLDEVVAGIEERCRKALAQA